MYIPFSYFGGGSNCINATGGITGSYISGSQVWKYHKFNTTGSASFDIISGNTNNAKLLIVGGGGAAGRCSTGTSVSFDNAGGGGAGGVFYAYNLALSSGSYSLYIGDGGLVTGSNGEDSWFQYPYTITNDSYYVSGDKITAYGGGHGGYINISSTISPSLVSSGSAGGWVSYDGTGASLTGSAPVFGQGYPSSKPSDYNLNVADNRAGGGSGAGGVGGVIPNSPEFPGNAKFFDITGPSSSIEVAAGGWGYSQGTGGSSALRLPGFGGDAVVRTNTTSRAIRGISGSVYIAYPVCDLELTCSQYVVYGGALGGNLTYIPCGQSELVTSAINPNYTGSICVQQVDGYPSASNTVNVILTGSCDTYIPLPTTPLCSGSEVQTATYIYNFQFLQQCYPTPSSCQQVLGLGGTITYTMTDGTPVTASYGLGYEYTGQICAREFPAPTISCNTGDYSFGSCSITKTDIVCGYYCSGSI
jgi:hypothetical protein